MKELRTALGNRLVLGALGLAFLSLFVWFAGPLIAIAGRVPLEAASTRLRTIGALWVLFLAFAGLRLLRDRRRGRAVLDAMVADDDPASGATAEERAALRAKMQEAVDVLQSRTGRRAIAELPWYMIIGPPGAGKTTLLANSGLDFPLEASHGRLSVKGVGGTRNCDWWFTDRAVLLDTAGRYTTQDSDAAVDGAAWNAFLALLREKRPRRPVNGLLLAIGLEDLLGADDAALGRIAHTLRARVDELYAGLGVAVPVYLIVTKCDLLAGFDEFFAKLDAPAREQVWGYTLPLDRRTARKGGDGGRDVAALVGPALDELVDRLARQTIDRLQAAGGQRQREGIYGFALQFRVARERIVELVARLARRSDLVEPLRFRGVYLTSATQTGSVLDAVIEKVSAGFGVPTDAAGARVDEGRSYFVNDLLEKVVFPEAGLAGTNRALERRLRRLQTGALALVGALLVGLLGLWGAGFVANRSALAAVDAAALELQGSLDGLSADSVALIPVAASLDRARSLSYVTPTSPGAGKASFPLSGTGLYPGDRVDAIASDKYGELLIDALLPRLMVRLEDQMRARDTDPEFLFEALKTYLMLDDRQHYDADAVIGWFNFDFDANLPPDVPVDVRDSLKSHVAALFDEQPFRLPRPLDDGLVRQYRAIAADTSLADRAGSRVRAVVGRDLPPFFRLTAAAGAEAARTFVREDGVALDRSVPSAFTAEAYRTRFVPAIGDVARTLADDAWVLGELGAAAEPISAEVVEAEVRARYHDEYIDAWEALIGQLRLRGVDDLGDATDLVSLLSAPDSPLKSLLGAIVDETRPGARPVVAADDASATERERELGGLLSGPDADPSGASAGPALDPVSAHFAPLHAFVEGADGGGAGLDALLAQTADLNLQLLPMERSPAGLTDPSLGAGLAGGLRALRDRAPRLPPPLGTLVAGMTGDIGDVVGGGFCRELENAWQTDVLAFYRRAISNRYPVNREGTSDVALADFTAFFGPGGLVQRFADTYLGPLVRRTPGKWTRIETDGPSCLSDNTLVQLARADDVRTTFFGAGAAVPSFRFELRPEALEVDAAIDSMFLDVAGQQTSYFHGPVVGTTSYAWPAPSGANTVQLRVEPVVPGASSGISLNGPWAVLRLFELGSRQGSPNGLTVSYGFSGRRVTLGFATSSFNPLDSASLRNFRAPERL